MSGKQVLQGSAVAAGSEELQLIVQKFKETRKELGYSQKRVALLAGVSRPHYQSIEAGNSAPRTETLISIGRVLGLSLVVVPQVWVPAVNALLRPDDIIDDAPGLIFRQLDEASD